MPRSERPRAPARGVRLGAAGAWAVLVSVLLWTSGPEAPSGWIWLGAFEEAGGDKLGHGGLFLVQAWLLCRCRRGLPTAAWLGGCLLLTVLFGALTEAVQVPLGGREGELGDLVADALGAAAGVAAFARWSRRR